MSKPLHPQRREEKEPEQYIWIRQKRGGWEQEVEIPSREPLLVKLVAMAPMGLAWLVPAILALVAAIAAAC